MSIQQPILVSNGVRNNARHRGEIICGSNHDEAPSPLTAPRGSHLTRDWCCAIEFQGSDSCAARPLLFVSSSLLTTATHCNRIPTNSLQTQTVKMSLQPPSLTSRPKGGSGQTTKAVILVGGPSRGTRFRPLSMELPKVSRNCT